jgi:hypothetical protein
MAVAFFEISVPRDGTPEPEPQRNKQKLIVKAESESEPSEQESAAKFVAEFFQRFDQNRDDIVEPQETPLAFRRFGFYQFDANGNGTLSREEILSAAERPRRKR